MLSSEHAATEVNTLCRHPFTSLFLQDSLGKLAPERLHQSGFNEARDDEMVVAHVDHLHLTSDR